jgi:exopolysaccharide biosynthesis protein
MKSIGCISAMNLDGGGSTAMIVNGVRLNSLLTGHGTATENRPVLSTLGFFKKK